MYFVHMLVRAFTNQIGCKITKNNSINLVKVYYNFVYF